MSMTDLLAHQALLERQLLCHLMADNSAAPALILQPGDFAEDFHRVLFDLVCESADLHLPFDRVWARDLIEARRLPVPDDWWRSLQGAASADQHAGDLALIRNLVDQIAETAAKRRFAGQLEGALPAIYDPAERLDRLTRRVALMLGEAQNNIVRQVDPSAEGIIKQIRLAPPAAYWPSGLTEIDQAVKGLHLGHLWSIVGRYKSRKTTCVLNVVNSQLEQGKQVMYLAFEDDSAAFLKKLIAVRSGVPHDWLDGQVHLSSAQQSRVDLAYAELEHQRLRIYDARHGVHNWRILPNLVAADRLRYGQIDVVVIDYLQAYSTRYEDLCELIPMLLKVTSEQNVCTLVISQMSNAAIRSQQDGQNTAGMLLTKGTGDLGAACHVGIEIERDLETPDDLMLNLKVARNGEPRRCTVTIDGPSGKIIRQGLPAPMGHVLADEDDEAAK